MSVLVHVCGDIDAAEEAVQDAFAAAVERWPYTGLPPSPAGWIITTARNRAIDRFHREATREDRHAEAVLLHPPSEAAEEGPVRDDQHLAIAPTPMVALNRAVAAAEIEGPSAALVLVDALDLGDYHLFRAIRADLLRRLGRNAEAAVAYDSAIARSENATERDSLQRRREELSAD